MMPALMRKNLNLILMFLAVAQIAASQVAQTSSHLEPTGKGWSIEVPTNAGRISPKIVTQGNGISYHGGPVMRGPVHAYFIWYGNWTNGPKPSDRQVSVGLINTLLGPSRGIGGSTYFDIATTYRDALGNVSGNVSTTGSMTNNYSRGKNISDADVATIVSSELSAGLSPDPNGIYFVLTSSDVMETSGFCTKYCGWHSHANIQGTDIKFAFVGNPDHCPLACEAQILSPNGDSGADGMASIMAHEAIETVTDPDLNAWYDSQGNEVGDKCAWKYGPYKTLAGHGAYNETLGTYNWLLQMQWENARGGGCDQALGGKFYNQ